MLARVIGRADMTNAGHLTLRLSFKMAPKAPSFE